MSVIEKEAINLLIAGNDGSEVVMLLKKIYKTPASLSSKISVIRKKALQQMKSTHKELQEFEDDVNVKTFLDSSVYDKLYMIKKHKDEGSVFACDAWKIIDLLDVVPTNFAAFRLCTEDSEKCKQLSEEAQIRKNDNVFVIDNADNILRNVVYNLENYANISVTLLACCLMIVSGRRLGEIMNGRSEFLKCESTVVQFRGQLKKRNDFDGYRVPLLTKSCVFLNAFAHLRSKQKKVHPNFAEWSNDHVTSKYQGNLTRQLHTSYPMFQHLHVFRSFYISAVYEMYETDITFARCAMLCLGHDSLKESLAYNNVRIEDFNHHRKIFGKLSFVADK